MADDFTIPDPGLLHEAVARNEERIQDLRRQLAEVEHLLEELESHSTTDRVPFAPASPGAGGKTGC